MHEQQYVVFVDTILHLLQGQGERHWRYELMFCDSLFHSLLKRTSVPGMVVAMNAKISCLETFLVILA